MLKNDTLVMRLGAISQVWRSKELAKFEIGGEPPTETELWLVKDQLCSAVGARLEYRPTTGARDSRLPHRAQR